MRRISVLALAILCVLSLAVGAVAQEKMKPEGKKALAQLNAAEISAAQATYEPEEPAGTDHTLRYAGANRFETAANLADFWWSPEDTFAVFLATGDSFADALSLGTSHFNLGPLLLARRDALPAPTARMIERLQPCLIVAVGGPSAISDAVLRQADALTEGTNQPDCQEDLSQ
jgi:putative cell wall-binding protein